MILLSSRVTARCWSTVPGARLSSAEVPRLCVSGAFSQDSKPKDIPLPSFKLLASHNIFGILFLELSSHLKKMYR